MKIDLYIQNNNIFIKYIIYNFRFGMQIDLDLDSK